MSVAAGQIALGTYAVLLAAGGVMGFVKARSQPSLIAGLLSAIVAATAVALSFRDPHNGLGLGLVLAAVLLALFGRRLAHTRKFMPAGLLCLASGVVIVVLAVVLAVPAAA